MVLLGLEKGVKEGAWRLEETKECLKDILEMRHESWQKWGVGGSTDGVA